MWSSITTPSELAKKLDANDSARKTVKRQEAPKFQNPTKPFELKKFTGKPRTETRIDEIKTNWKNKETPKNRNEIFDKRKEITCFACKNSQGTIYIYVPI